MILGLLVLITALCISAVAIYYSVSGLVAIFAAAALPIVIMGGALEIGKLVTAVWLHKYWHKARWWLKYYLAIAVVVLMFITSMGIFGFLSKAHIEQTSAANEGIAQIERIEQDLTRQLEIITRAEQRITEAEASVGTGNTAIQEQIDKEQERIDTAYTRIEPAIVEQNGIIENARIDDASRTSPYEDQLTNITDEIIRLETSAKEYETQISSLVVDASSADTIVAQISTINATITKVEGQIASNEREQIKQAQSTIGANPDGAAGPNTRRAANAWIEQQKIVVTDLNAQVATIRKDATTTVNNERTRLASVVKDIREIQIPALKERELVVLGKIDEVRNTESPIITTARDEIARIRASADAQVVASQTLIQRLRDSLTVGKDATVEAIITEQTQKIITANNDIDSMTQTKYTLQAEYRKLEAEVGPIKYLAEFIYGDTDQDILEEAVRWVIITIIFVFDPLAVLLLIASQATFEMRRSTKTGKENNNDNKIHDRKHDEYAPTADRNSTTASTRGTRGTEEDDSTTELRNTTGAGQQRGSSDRLDEKEQLKRSNFVETLEGDDDYKAAKKAWKTDNPNQNIKYYKDRYIKGKDEDLPWHQEPYVQNNEQDESSLWRKLQNRNE